MIGLVDKLRALEEVKKIGKKSDGNESYKIQILEEILFKDHFECPAKDNESFFIKLNNDHSSQSSKIAVARLDELGHMLDSKAERIQLTSINDTVPSSLVYWILSDKNWDSHSSTTELINSIKEANEEYLTRESLRYDELFRDSNGEPLTEETIIKNVNSMIVKKMMDTYKSIMVSINQIEDYRLMSGLIMDEVLFTGIFNSLNFNSENRFQVAKSLIDGVRNLPNFGKEPLHKMPNLDEDSDGNNR